MQHKITNSSKIKDLELRVAAMFQVAYMIIAFLEQHPGFIISEGMSQPFLPDATKMKEKYMSHAIVFLEACQKKNETFAGEDASNNVAEDMFNANVDTDVLLFRGPSHKCVRELTRRVNPCTGFKRTKD